MLLPVLAVIVVLAFVILACGESSTNTGTKTGTNGGPTATGGSSTTSSHFKVGDQVKVGDSNIVTVNSFKTAIASEFEKPKSGNQFVVADVTVKNTSSESQSISSIAQFTLKDSTGQKYTETILSTATPPDGELAAGDTVKGQIAYEVPAAQHDFTLAFQADIMSSGQTIWDLHI
jgi:uncharacterized protein DUF4352